MKSSKWAKHLSHWRIEMSINIRLHPPVMNDVFLSNITDTCNNLRLKSTVSWSPNRVFLTSTRDLKTPQRAAGGSDSPWLRTQLVSSTTLDLFAGPLPVLEFVWSVWRWRVNPTEQSVSTLPIGSSDTHITQSMSPLLCGCVLSSHFLRACPVCHVGRVIQWLTKLLDKLSNYRKLLIYSIFIEKLELYRTSHGLT